MSIRMNAVLRRLPWVRARTVATPPASESTDQAERLATAAEEIDSAQRELEALDAERAELIEERRRLQRVLGERVGKRIMSLAKVEKTNGTPSFLAGARLLQRVHRRADEPGRGLDGAGAIFEDRARTKTFAHSHGLPASVLTAVAPSSEAAVVVHAFHGEVGLVEVRHRGRTCHFDPAGADVGDIRSTVAYDPEIPPPPALSALCAWSATLSAHISRPYVQVLWDAEEGGPVLRAIDVDPARIPALTPEWDRRLGDLFDSAHARMLLQPYRAGALANRVPGGTFTSEDGR